MFPTVNQYWYQYYITYQMILNISNFGQCAKSENQQLISSFQKMNYKSNKNHQATLYLPYFTCESCRFLKNQHCHLSYIKKQKNSSKNDVSSYNLASFGLVRPLAHSLNVSCTWVSVINIQVQGISGCLMKFIHYDYFWPRSCIKVQQNRIFIW